MSDGQAATGLAALVHFGDQGLTSDRREIVNHRRTLRQLQRGGRLSEFDITSHDGSPG
jgi:hypothetical protein